MSFLKYFVVAVATILSFVFVHSIPLDNGRDGNINQLVFIGSVDGKFYFAEGNVTATWKEAQGYCKLSGMHLATITSIAQSTLLKNAYNNETFWNCYWTGGRDSRRQSQFVWDFNDELLSSSIATPFDTQEEQNCICFHPDDGYFHGRSCNDTFKILCELLDTNQ